MDKLAKIRTGKLIPLQDMVDIVRTRYPKMDKPLLSKAMNGELYGISLRSPAVKLLMEKFAPEERAKKDARRLPCRIYGRLDKIQYAALQRHLKADGYNTVQDWIADMVRDYNRRYEDDEHT